MNRRITAAAGALALTAAMTVGLASPAAAYSVKECRVAGQLTFRVSAWSANGWTTVHYKAIPPYKKIVRTGPDTVYRWTQAKVPSLGLRNRASDGYFRYKGTGARVVEGQWYGIVGIFDGYQSCSVKIAP